MKQDEECKVLCESDIIPIDDAKFINKVVTDGYAFNWAVDGLPAANEDIDVHTNEKYYNIGFKVGSTFENVPYLNNHYGIDIHYHVTSHNQYRVVGVVVDPLSRDTKIAAKGKEQSCTEGVGRFHLKEDGKSKVVYTYSVKWIVSFFDDERMCGLSD
jgi:transmembrane 9 superfamily protein 2/4